MLVLLPCLGRRSICPTSSRERAGAAWRGLAGAGRPVGDGDGEGEGEGDCQSEGEAHGGGRGLGGGVMDRGPVVACFREAN